MAYMATAALVLAAGGMAMQHKSGQQQKKAIDEERAVARAQQVRERQQQIRQARIQRAQAVNQAYVSGGVGSPLSNAESSIGTQLGANLAFNQGTLRRSERAAGFKQSAVDYGTAASNLTTLSSLAGSMASPVNKLDPRDAMLKNIRVSTTQRPLR